MTASQAIARVFLRRGSLSDDELVSLAMDRDEGAVRVLIQRHNRRLFRVARGILRNDDEAEDVVQATYVRAFTQLHRFRGEAAFSTWLTRIALNEAYGRLRRQRPMVELSEIDAAAEGGQVIMFPSMPRPSDPEAAAGREQVRHLLEKAFDRLPEAFRTVFILRELEGLTTEETADLLAIKPETVKTRLFRARRLMRVEIEKAVSTSFAGLFPFGGSRCAKMADDVIARLRCHARW